MTQFQNQSATIFNGIMSLKKGTDIPASGSATITPDGTGNFYEITTYSTAITTITVSGVTAGMEIVLRNATGGVVNFASGGNITMGSGPDPLILQSGHVVRFIYTSTDTNWHPIAAYPSAFETYQDGDTTGLRFSGYNFIVTTSPGNGDQEAVLDANVTQTLTDAPADGNAYAAGIDIDPGYTAASAITVARHNYLNLRNVSGAGAGPAAITDSCVMRFDDTPTNHNALVQAGEGSVTCSFTNDGPSGIGTVTPSAWVKININDTVYFMPAWT